MKTLFKNANLINENGDILTGYDLLVEDGIIAETGKDICSCDAETIDCTDKFITPGFVSMHCHTPMNIFKGIAEDVHVRIADHVWVGMESAVIYNSDIGEHSMVGAMSLVKGTYPDHVVIAGNRAKVIRENIDWDYRDYMTYPEYEEMMREREEAKKRRS